MPRKPITQVASGKIETSKALISKFHKNPLQKCPSEVSAYQKASLKYGTVHNTSKWLIKNLMTLKLIISHRPPLLLLDVGTLVPGYNRIKWLTPSYINLQVPPNGLQLAIHQHDYLKYTVSSRFNIICLSLVLNFVPTPDQRGQMLKKAWSDLVSGGFLYIVLPLACVQNSKYIDVDEFGHILSLIGFKLVHSHTSPKLFYAIYQKTKSRTNL